MNDKFTLIKSIFLLAVVFLVSSRHLVESQSYNGRSKTNEAVDSNDSIQINTGEEEVTASFARIKTLMTAMRKEINALNFLLTNDDEEIPDRDEHSRSLGRDKKNALLKSYLLKRGMKTVALGFGK